MKNPLKFRYPRFAPAASASLFAFALFAAPGMARAEGGDKTPAATNVDRSVPKDPVHGGADTVMPAPEGRSDTASKTMQDRARRDTADLRDTLPPDSGYVPVRPGF